jgi:hypothetical protein
VIEITFALRISSHTAGGEKGKFWPYGKSLKEVFAGVASSALD